MYPQRAALQPPCGAHHVYRVAIFGVANLCCAIDPVLALAYRADGRWRSGHCEACNTARR